MCVRALRQAGDGGLREHRSEGRGNVGGMGKVRALREVTQARSQELLGLMQDVDFICVMAAGGRV